MFSVILREYILILNFLSYTILLLYAQQQWAYMTFPMERRLGYLAVYLQTSKFSIFTNEILNILYKNLVCVGEEIEKDAVSLVVRKRKMKGVNSCVKIYPWPWVIDEVFIQKYCLFISFAYKYSDGVWESFHLSFIWSSSTNSYSCMYFLILVVEVKMGKEFTYLRRFSCWG